MNDLEEIEVRILIAEPAYCQYRVQGNRHFGWNESPVCPFRKKLAADFYLCMADRERKRNKHKYKDEQCT